MNEIELDMGRQLSSPSERDVGWIVEARRPGRGHPAPGVATMTLAFVGFAVRGDPSEMRVVSTLVLGAALCASPVAHAQDSDVAERPSGPSRDGIEEGPEARARIHFMVGSTHYDAGAYVDALRQWQRAYEISGRAEILRSLSLAYEALGDFRAAHDSLRRYLDEVEAIPDRADVELRLERLGRSLSDHEAELPRAPEPETHVSSGAIVGFVASGVGLVTLAIAGGLALDEDLRLRDACASLCAPGAADDLRTFALIGDLGLGLSIAGAALGLLFLFADRGPDRSATVSVAPLLGDEGGGLLVRGRL
ncbi:MAG: tetratricopeptide repeat protein [Myxococcales bacterium]|nr:tetratricopeptide repeat protein [Myxococcales bacterium]